MKPFEYMNDWNCSAPSSSQIRPSTVWIVRRGSDAKYARARASGDAWSARLMDGA